MSSELRLKALAASPRSPHLGKNADRVTGACTGRGPKQSDLKEKSKCLCSVGLNTTMEHSAGMNRRVALEAGFLQASQRSGCFSSVPASDRLGFEI